MLLFKNLHIGFTNSRRRENRLLFDTGTIEFYKGEFVAVIGPNGSGKTTLFNTMLSYQIALQGELIFNGVNWKEVKRANKAKKISFVPSKFHGINHLTVYELISMGRAPYTNFLNQLRLEDREVVEKVLNQLGLKDFKTINTIDLSDGERQITMIGKALAQASEIMILDEPTAFLDYNNRRKVLQLLKEVTLQNKQLTFISSHDLDLCFEYCNRVIAIDKKNKKLLDFTAPFDKKKIVELVFGLK